MFIITLLSAFKIALALKSKLEKHRILHFLSYLSLLFSPTMIRKKDFVCSCLMTGNNDVFWRIYGFLLWSKQDTKPTKSRVLCKTFTESSWMSCCNCQANSKGCKAYFILYTYCDLPNIFSFIKCFFPPYDMRLKRIVVFSNWK